MTERQAPLRHGEPIWLADAGRSKARYRSLRGHHRSDIAIVGGGITAALIADAFARDGVSVSVLEAGLVGRGSTAASSALLLREPDRGLANLSRRYGEAAATRIWQLCHEGVRDLISTLRRLRIPCELSTRDAIYFATTVDAAERLKVEFTRRRENRLGGRWLSPAALHRATGVTGYGAIRTAGHAQLNPYEACVGVLAAAKRAGAAIFERSNVRRIRQVPDGVRLETSSGTVDAKKVVIATGYATERFRPLAGRFTMYRTYVVTTPPIGAADRRRIGFRNVMVWDTERPYHYARWAPDHRLMLGGADRRVVPGARRNADFSHALSDLRNRLAAMFPALSSANIGAAWEGLFAMTPDGLPYIGEHRRYPGHLFALGYGGNGMTFACLAARLLVEQWKGHRSSDHDLFAFGRGRKSRKTG